MDDTSFTTTNVKWAFHILSSTQNMHLMNCVKLKYMVIYYSNAMNRPIFKFPNNVNVYLILKLFLTQKGCHSSFGENCSHKCPKNCQGSICDSNTGHCFSCESVYKGLNCSQCVYSNFLNERKAKTQILNLVSFIHFLNFDVYIYSIALYFAN